MLDAGQAFHYARGAMWHLEVAAPQFRAAATASRTGDLVGAAAEHVDASMRDLAAAAARMPGMAGVADAALAGMLAQTARHARMETMQPHAAADIVDAARWRVQESIDRIVPVLDADQELLSLTPGATAPSHELALIDDVTAAREFRRTSDVQRAQVRRILADGSIDREPIRWVGGYGNGNGAMPMVRVRHPETPHLSVAAVQRPPTAQAAQEEFFAELATAAGTDHHFAPVARRADGSALVLAVPGGASWENGVHSGADVRHVLADWYRSRFAGLDAQRVAEAGAIDFDKLRTMDYVAAQPDRNAGAPLVDRAAGDVRYIDNGFAGRGETHDVRRPGLKTQFLDGDGATVRLHPTAARELATALGDDALRAAHAVLGRGPDGELPRGHALALRQDASRGYLEALRARRDQVATGTFDYVPIHPDADPIAHMDELRRNRHPW